MAHRNTLQAGEQLGGIAVKMRAVAFFLCAAAIVPTLIGFRFLSQEGEYIEFCLASLVVWVGAFVGCYYWLPGKQRKKLFWFTPLILFAAVAPVELAFLTIYIWVSLLNASANGKAMP